MAFRLLDDFEFRAGVDVSTIDLVLRGGQALVRGTVSDADEIQSIRDSLEDEQGIDRVDVSLQIATSRREEDRDLAREVQEVLDQDRELSPVNVQVASLSNQIVLRGTVRTALQKAKAGLLAMRCRGVERIKNRIVVN